MSTIRKQHIHETDVVICGSGSAGVMAGLWLAKYGIPFRMLERRDGPLKTGQADGVQCRTVEIFESFGLADKLVRESYHAVEIGFYGSDEATALDGSENGQGGGIKCSHYIVDTDPGLSHLPHVILNQARINEMLIEEMIRHGGPNVEYGYEVEGVRVDEERAGDPDDYPVMVTTVKDGEEEIIFAKYALVGWMHSVALL